MKVKSIVGALVVAMLVSGCGNMSNKGKGALIGAAGGGAAGTGIGAAIGALEIGRAHV